MSDVSLTIAEDPGVVIQVIPGGPVTLNTGVAGQADLIRVSPAITGFGSNVQTALQKIATELQNPQTVISSASDVSLGTPITNLPGISNTKDALIELAKDIAVQISFTQAALTVAGILPYVHGRDTTTPNVEVFNELGEIVKPDNIRIVSPNEIGVVLKSFEPIPGSWRVKVSRG